MMLKFHIEITAIDPTMTHHIDPTTDHPHTDVPQTITPEIKVDPTHVHSTNPPREIHTDHIHIPAKSCSKPHHKKDPRVKIEHPHMDYNSSDDNSNNAGEETDHLN